MSLLHMETDMVRDVGNQLQQAAGSLRQQAQQLNNSAQTLASVWQGNSSNIFIGDFQLLLQQLNEFANAGDALNQRLRNEVDEWESIGNQFGIVGTYLVGFDAFALGGQIPLLSAPYLHIRENFFDLSDYVITADEFRGWVNEAASYHDVPPELLAVILQQENSPEASTFQRVGQWGERNLGTAVSVADRIPLVGKLIPDEYADNATGIGNIKRSTLEGAVKYVETTYNKDVMPTDVKDTAVPFLHRDQRIGGLDIQSDLYYVSAHLRELIDRIAGDGQPYSGPLDREMIEKIAAAYNGSGPDAEKYGKDALQRLDQSVGGESSLRFL